MKRILLITCCALALSALGPVSASAGIRWPLHRHRKDPAAAKADKPEKGKKAKHHREKSRDKGREKAAREEAGVSPGPRSVGWRYPQPGPAGAGAH